MSPATPAPVKGVRDTARAIADGAMTCADAVEFSLARIAALDGRINAFTQVFADEARARAASLDGRIARGERASEDIGPLCGVPIAIKDNICTTLGRTTCASRFLESYRSPFDATAVERLERAGAVIVGKTNLDEFAMGSSGEHSFFGPTKNPHAQSRVPGGSSSGSAAAVAAGMVAAALGSDTGGSIRQPAALCGVVGMKPTYGTVSRYGLVAFASSLDQIGPFAANTRDASTVLDVIAGHDPRDSTSLQPEHDGSYGFTDALTNAESAAITAAGLRIGIPADLLNGSVLGAIDDEVLHAFRNASALLSMLGATTTDIRLKHAACAVSAYYLISSAEASSNLARFDGVRYGRRAEIGPGDGIESLMTRSRTEGFGAEVRRRIMLGTYALSSGYYDAYYMTALRARRLIRNDFDDAFNSCDMILMPTTVSPAFRIGEKLEDPVSMYLEDVFTVSVNLAGLPAINIPAGWCNVQGDCLPVGVQLIGPMHSERALLRAAAALEHALAPAQADA